MEHEDTGLLLGGAGESPGWALPAEARTWLERALRDHPAAPRIPVSDLERLAVAAGLDYEELRLSPPDIGELVQGHMRILFPLSRLRALRRWLVRTAKAQENPADAAAAEDTLAYLRSFDRPTTGPRRNAVLDTLVLVSLREAEGFDALRGRVALARRRNWPGTPAPSSQTERLLRWIHVRVPPVDLLPGLCALAPRRRQTTAPAPAPPSGPLQLSLLEAAPTGDGLDDHALDAPGREALAHELEAWSRRSLRQPETARLALTVAQGLRGGRGAPEALDLLVRMSVLELTRATSAAERARLDAVLTADDDDPSPLVDYGDYLARAQRTREAVRAYQRARLRVPPAERDKIDERLRAREDRLSRVQRPVYGPRPDPDQLRLDL